jgi:spore photoproduct lyase
VLELKTKSNTVEDLLSLDHGGRVVVAWSLNAHEVISQEEHRCATLEERLVAAERVVEAGYLVAFHFDPMIYHSGWESGYDDVVNQLFSRIDPARIAWVSMGSLRFPPSMQREMERRFPNTGLTLGEMLIGNDGKKRYIKPIRLALYQRLLASIRAAGGEDLFVYLCMESQEVWRRVMQYVPESNNALDFEFSVNLVRKYPYLLPNPPQWSDYSQAVNLGMGAAKTD